MSEKGPSLPYVVEGPPVETKSQLAKAAEANARHEVLKGISSDETDVMNVQDRKCKVEIYYIVIALVLGAGLLGVLVYFTVINTVNVDPEPVEATPKIQIARQKNDVSTGVTETTTPVIPAIQLRNMGPMARQNPAPTPPPPTPKPQIVQLMRRILPPNREDERNEDSNSDTVTDAALLSPESDGGSESVKPSEGSESEKEINKDRQIQPRLLRAMPGKQGGVSDTGTN